MGQREEQRERRLERTIGALFLLLTGLFLVEVRHYFETGSWVIHGGLGAFARWPAVTELRSHISLHALGMLAWMGVVVHQLATRGAGLHKWVGRVGGLMLLAALAIAWRPTLASRVPALHGALGLTLQDLTLGVTIVGIVVELGIGVYEARRGDIELHRKHLLVSVMFTAAPAVYRIGVYLGTAILDLQDSSADVWATAWVHEMSLCVSISMAMVMLLSRRFGAHLDVLRAPEGRDRVERGTAWIMVAVIATLVLVYSLWIIDLLWMWSEGTQLLLPGAQPTFVLRFVGLG